MPKKIMIDIFVKKEEGYFQAHCLQFDLVATDDSLINAKEAMLSLCREHIIFALKNNNMDYLFSPAPKEIWDEYLKCAQNPDNDSEEGTIDLARDNDNDYQAFIPAFMTNQTLCHV